MWPPTTIRALSQTSVLLTSDGKLFSAIFDQNRLCIPLHQVAEPVLRCLIATEDQRFFSHYGIDPIGILRAAYVNVRALRIVQGGSTITQQLARMAVLRRSDRSLRRKMIELLAALWIERRLTKLQILEIYLNAAYFGHSVFGIEQAALTLCGKRAAHLDEADAAYLVGLLKAPGRYCRCCNPARAEQRTRLVMHLSHLRGEHGQACQVREWKSRRTYADIFPCTAAYVREFVRKSLLHLVPDHFPARRLVVSTTIDPVCQGIVESVCEASRRSGYLGRLGCVIQDAHSGDIKALAGGTRFQDQPFNAATDGLLQPGSLLKPFILLAALQQGISPEKQYESHPLAIKLDGGRVWNVRNAAERYGGLMSIADATVHSDNTVYAQLLQDVGLTRVQRMLTDVGIPTRRPALSLSTGAISPGVSPLQICNAYSAISANGYSYPHSIIRRITEENGTVLFDNNTAGRRVCTSCHASTVKAILRRVVLEGTGRLRANHCGLAAKTGTSDSGQWYASFDNVYRVLTWTESDFTPFGSPFYYGKATSAKELADRIWRLLRNQRLGFQELYSSFECVHKLTVLDLLWVEDQFQGR